MFFPDVDRLFREMDEMMEDSFVQLSRPSMLAQYPQAQGMGLSQPLGFDVTPDDKEFKVTMNLGDVQVNDVDLQLDSDGRVLRLKGNKVQEEGGMKIQSSFEKAILLHPEVDSEKISARSRRRLIFMYLKQSLMMLRLRLLLILIMQLTTMSYQVLRLVWLSRL